MLLLVLHGPIATNILNIYTFSVATQALDIKIPRRTLSVLVGVLAMGVVIYFIFQKDFATVLDTWLVGLVAWVATWGGIMLVHYYRVERQAIRVDRLFDPPGTPRLPDMNWAGYIAFFVGLFCTWLFMYGLIPIFQGPIATALGGIDLSWLAGGAAAAAVYAVLGPIAAAKYEGAAFTDSVPSRAGTSAPQIAPAADAAGTPEGIA